MVQTLAQRLSPFDLALVAVYLVAITLFGLKFAKRSSKSGSLKSYFLADNTIPWWAIALSIVSAETSTLTIVSIPGVAFAGNMGFLQVVIGYMIGRIVVALLFLPRYFRGEMLTAYQLIDRRFGKVLYKVTAGLFLLTRAAAEGVRVFAISIVVSIAIGTGDTLSIAIISALTLLYTFEGGMAAVIWTDVVQMGLYVAGTLVALYTLGAHVPGNWTHIYEVAAPLGKFHIFNFAFNLTQSYTFWAGLLGGTFLTMASHGTDQLMVQRMLAARNLRESRLALLSSGVVIFFQFTLFLLIGIGLFVFYGMHPQVFSSSDRIFPTFIVQQMPHGVAGLLVAAILAAAMSNLSAALNSLSSTTVVDFYVPFRPAASDRERGLVSRISTVWWALVLFGIAVYSIQVGGKGHVVETGLSIASVAYGCLLGVFLLGTLTKYATQWGAILGMVCGFVLNVWLWKGTFPVHIVGVTVPQVAFTWFVLIGAGMTFLVGSIFSFVLPRPKVVALLVVLGLGCSAGAQVSGKVASGDAHLRSDEAGPKMGHTEFDGVSAAINAAIAEKKLPGAVVVVGHKGKVVFHQAYGNRALEPTVEPMTEDTIFDMASLTKLLATTTSILELVDQKKIDLDAPVVKYLAEFGQNGKDKITVRQLMTHYSGLPEDVDLKDDWGLKAPDKAEGIRRAMASVPYGPPGVTFKYSDINFITLGVLVEILSGQTLDVFVQEHVFTTLLMAHTRYLPIGLACGSAQDLPPYSLGAIFGNSHLTNGIADCWGKQWPAANVISHVAPTAHDDESKAHPELNPNFDTLLRGTVHDPTTRRMGGVAGHAGVFSTAADMSKFAQALLDKLLRNTGPFPVSQATLRMATTPNEPATAVHTATIFTPDGKATTGVASRGLGWDLNSGFSRPRGEVFPIATKKHPGSFGHTGFTGTSLWIDPVSDSYVVLLANAIHPRGGAPISGLRGQVATAAAHVITGMDEGKAERKGREGNAAKVAEGVATGIDVLEATQFAALEAIAEKHGGKLKFAVLTNQSGIDSQSRRTIDVLAHAGPALELTTIFTPEHGLLAKQDTEHLTAEQDGATKLPVISLYGPKASDKHPKQADLKKVDAVVIDLQDAGVRFWTYATVMGYFLEDCARAHVEVIVLDRPNPVGGLTVQGPLSDVGSESYINFMSLPVRHGMTFGELAKFFNDYGTQIQLKPELLDGQAVQMGQHEDGMAPPATKPGLHAMLTIVPVQHWSRAEFFDETHLPWTPPSPNMKTPATNVVYPGVALMETTNMSVGRGSPAPYENFGAPFVKADELAAYLTARKVPGAEFSATTLAIAEDSNRYPFHGQTIPAIHINVTNRAELDTPEMGVELLSALHHLYPTEFQIDKAKTILLNADTLAAIKADKDPREIAAGWAAALKAFRVQRSHELLY